MQTHQLFINGQYQNGQEVAPVKSPYNGAVIAQVHRAGQTEIEQAIAAAHTAFEHTRKLSSAHRCELLEQVSRGLQERQEEFARTIALEAGKPIKSARGEVQRAITTFRLASQEALRLHGEVLPLDILPANQGRWGLTRRFPLGAITGIAPFNFPLNLVAHKVAPALAVGNTIVLKPASQTPLSALLLAEVIQAAGAVAGSFNVVVCPGQAATPLITDNRIKKITFTGSAAVGWEIKRQAATKRVTLELGGNAAAIVHSDADLDYAVSRCVLGAFAYAGQICISVQRILVAQDIFETFVERFVAQTRQLQLGDPLNEATDVGPMINLAEAQRVEEWVQEAVQAGAQVLVGGQREGALYQPTVLTAVKPESRVWSEEVFAPVVVIKPYSSFEQALALTNDSSYGLQAGVFTRDSARLWQAFEELEVGGVMGNDFPTFRADNMPYGGIKKSGYGREGIRYAIEEMTEIKILALNFQEH